MADIIMIGPLFDQKIVDIAEYNLQNLNPDGGEMVCSISLCSMKVTSIWRDFRGISVCTLSNRDTGSNRPYVIQRMNKVNIGDRLNDNRTIPDGYRFHDVFHLSYLVHLGWSPVIRALLKIKRKSKPEIDENEDGARANIIEEGIATWIFNHASKRNFFEGNH